MTINILFMGSPDYSVPILKSLNKEYNVRAVFTQPDKPSGRGKRIQAPIIKNFAESIGIPVYQPKKLLFEDFQPIMKSQRIDIVIVAAYGKILPKWLLEYPKYGALNVHASLLPRWRGASPIQAAILNGDQETGVTIMKMNEGIDTGDILIQKPEIVSVSETSDSLGKKLANLGANLIVETIELYIKGEIEPRKQDDEQATYTRQIKKADGRLDFHLSANTLERQVRAYNPWPICFLEWDSEVLKVYGAGISDTSEYLPNQRGVIEKYPCIGTSTHPLILRDVQSAGKNRMDGKAFLNGARNWLLKN
ncbi:MAG TPA: methionyl-tRNA formyltransferase [Pelolinea sp.]|nr:methionyl-tRNA formyltransferase [Pelolinea sp.]